MSERTMEGRNAVVLAASRGLGRAVAEAFAGAGANVALCARDGELVGRVAEEIGQRHGVRTLGVAADVSDGQDLSDFIAAAGIGLGGIDHLVTNAGGPPAGTFLTVPEEAWLSAFSLNLLSVVRAVRAALPYLEQRPGASITCIVSSSVKVPIPHLVLSNALRPAIVGLARTLATELAPGGIRVNCVAPGRIDTERVRTLDEIQAASTGRSAEEVRQRSEASIPLGRYGTPEEFAEAVLWLASPAARYVTGQTLFVDGGLVPTLF